MNPVVWKDPPPSTREKREPDFMEVLRANPGRWGVVALAKSGSMCITLRKKYGLESTSRRLPDGRFEIYAKVPAPARQDSVTRVVGRVDHVA